MPTPVRYLDDAEVTLRCDGVGFRAGEVWYAPESWIKRSQDGVRVAVHGYALTEHYLTHVAVRRRPIVIMLTDQLMFVVDSQQTNGSQGWDVENDDPVHLTVKPSIDCGALFHGWVTDGVITP